MPHRPGSRGPMARLVESPEFERALRSRSRVTTAHFAAHHVERHAPRVNSPKLSTTLSTAGARPVDEYGDETLARWLGAVVPKRHARRAVTRSLLKRQIYGVAERHRAALAGGVWVVRLRAPFDRALFPSAASESLKASARAELELLFSKAFAVSANHVEVLA